MNLWATIKGLLVQDQTDRTKELSIEIDPASTTGTRTTVKSVQTANRTITLPNATDTLVGKATSDVLTNKTIDADGTGNVITNIENENIKAAAAIDASKIADGSVSNTEFQYINSVTSNVQTQLNTNATAISDHTSDATDAHDASAISNVPSGNLAATDIQAAVNELQSDIDTRALNSDLSNHLSDSSDAHDASAISNVPSGNLSATDVQAALNELQSDIDLLVPGGAANLQLSNLSGTTDIPVDLIFDKASNKTIRLENESGTSVGKNLTIKAGQSSGADQTGGNLILSAGESTGMSDSGYIDFKVSPASVPGSTVNTPQSLMKIESTSFGIGQIIFGNSTIGSALTYIGQTIQGLLALNNVNSAGAAPELKIQGSSNSGAGVGGKVIIHSGDGPTTDGNIEIYAQTNGIVDIQSTVSMNSKKITNVLNPTAAQDAATKDYVDNAISASSSTVEYTASATPTVPAWANRAEILACGGGGGGGGGGSGTNGSGGACGASGGAGSAPIIFSKTVVPSETLTITIGAGGTGGNGGTGTSANGTGGASGGTTTITGTNIDIAIPGGSGGIRGTNRAGADPGDAVTTFADTSYITQTLAGASGAGALYGNNAGSASSKSFNAPTAAAGGSAGGSAANSGGGGGGGGPCLGKGGDGGDATSGASAGGPGDNAPAGNYGAGGGGGAGGSASVGDGDGGDGGDGMSGYVKITYYP